MSIIYNGEKAKFTITHAFRASKESVFNAFACKDALAEWWGPAECKNTVLKLDFRKGGTFHYKMEKDGNVNYGRFIFGEIHPYDLIEFTNSFSDESGNKFRAPFDRQLPLEVFYRLIFTESNDITTITMTGLPVKASHEEITRFQSINSNLQKGFGATFSQLASYLTKTQNNQ